MKIGAATSIPTYYRMLLRGQLTRGRLVGLGTLSAISVLLAFVARNAGGDEPPLQLLSSYSIAVLIPLTTLILATPMLGNLVEDRLLVYLWSKPVPRWHLAVAAFAAVVTVLVPFVAVPVALTGIIGGVSSVVVPAIVASVLGVVAYSAMYLFIGLRFTWGLWLGLLYLVLWENILSNLSDGIARLSIRSYLVTILQRGSDVIELSGAGRATWASFVIPLAVAVVAVGLTAWTLASADVD